MILQSIEIENFRCFRHSRFENFGQVNLIGGKNNAGKTALLEAILLGNKPTFDSIGFLQQLRNEEIEQYFGNPGLAWENLFFQQNKKMSIKIRSIYGVNLGMDVDISCTELVKKPLDKSSKNMNGELTRILDNTPILEITESNLLIKSKSPNGSVTNELKVNQQEKPKFFNRALEKPVHPIREVFLIPTGFKKRAIILAIEFDSLKLQNNENTVLEAFKIIDDSIEKVDTISHREPRIYIFRKGEKPQPLNFFGDALNKIADLILRISNNPNCILLIDEIENGIHHDNQQEFWQMLIKLAVSKDVQIFATSHSAEMIGAFQAAAIANKQEEKVRFIEMYKSKRTGEIV